MSKALKNKVKLNDIVSVKDFGAVGDGVTDDTAAIQAAVTAGKVVLFPSGSYLQTSPITLQDGQILHMGGATIKPSTALTTAAWVATSATGIRIYGGTFEGAGTAFSTGNENLMVLTSCSDVQMYGTKFTKSRNEGLRLSGCTDCVLQGVVAVNNYGTGLQDRDGVNNKWVTPTAENNGTTGAASGVNGRGLLIWRCLDTEVMGGSYVGNTEYGVRVYSQSGDATGSSNIKVIGAHAEDNGAIDFYSYNESGLVSQIEFIGCTVRRTTDPTGACVALQGAAVSWIGGSITKIGARMATAVFNMYGLTASRVSGAHVVNAGPLFSWSGASICDDVLIDSNIADCSVVGALVGTKVTYRGNKFKHGGAGATDIAIDAGSTYSPVIDSNEFDGFYRNISWVAQAITLTNNTSRNTTDVSLRMNGDGVAGLAISGNDLDTGSNPTWVATAYRQKNANSRITVYGGAAPTTLTWARGDRFVQANPTVGLPKSWVCTAAGTPGTWVSEGNL